MEPSPYPSATGCEAVKLYADTDPPRLGVSMPPGRVETANRTRADVAGRGALMVRLAGPPGAGKTALLAATAKALAGRLAVVVVNPAPARDAAALRPLCAAVESIAATVPEPAEVRGAVAKVLAARPKVVVVEACGGIAPFPDVGEDATVAMMCVSGGDDKADEYRALVARADLVLLGKADLAPYVSFDASVFRADVRRHNPLAKVIELSVTDGRNLSRWVTWLEERAASKRRQAARRPGAPPHGR